MGLFRLAPSLLPLGLVAAIFAGLPGHAVRAQEYPIKPVKLIIPTPAGGPSDTTARAMTPALSKSLGQQIVVENRPGASGAIAAQAVHAAPPDGYTLLWAFSSMVAIPLLQQSPPFQSLTEFSPVSNVGWFAFGLFVHPSVPATSVAEFVNYARANPDKLSFATGALGEYMVAAQFMKAAGISMVRVPYKGAAQLLPDLIAGRVQVNFGPVFSAGLQHLKEGKLRMLVTIAPQRVAMAADVPTIGEAGIAGIAISGWQAIFGPPKTPQPIVERLSREIAQVLRDPAIRAQLERQALRVDGSTPQALTAHVVEGIESWRVFIRENNITQE